MVIESDDEVGSEDEESNDLRSIRMLEKVLLSLDQVETSLWDLDQMNLSDVILRRAKHALPLGKCAPEEIDH